MKHILFNIFKGLLLAGAAAVCIVFYLYTIDFFAPPPQRQDLSGRGHTEDRAGSRGSGASDR